MSFTPCSSSSLKVNRKRLKGLKVGRACKLQVMCFNLQPSNLQLKNPIAHTSGSIPAARNCAANRSAFWRSCSNCSWVDSGSHRIIFTFNLVSWYYDGLNKAAQRAWRFESWIADHSYEYTKGLSFSSFPTPYSPSRSGFVNLLKAEASDLSSEAPWELLR